MRPYIICHMMSLLDGRIDCDVTEQIEDGNEYYDALYKLDCSSTASSACAASSMKSVPKRRPPSRR